MKRKSLDQLFLASFFLCMFYLVFEYTISFSFPWRYFRMNPANIYLFKVNNNVWNMVKVNSNTGWLRLPLRQWPKFVGNKAKGRISKRVLQEKKACQIILKANISYLLLRTLTYAYQRVRNFRFTDNLAGFFFLQHAFWDSLFCLINRRVGLVAAKWLIAKSMV